VLSKQTDICKESSHTHKQISTRGTPRRRECRIAEKKCRPDFPTVAQKLFENSKKLAHTRLPSVGFRSWSRFLAVSLQVTWVINPAVGCHYFPPGPQLPSQPLRRLLPFSLLGEQMHDGREQFALDVTRQLRGCDLNPGPSAPESSTLTTRLPSRLRE